VRCRFARPASVPRRDNSRLRRRPATHGQAGVTFTLARAANRGCSAPCVCPFDRALERQGAPQSPRICFFFFFATMGRGATTSASNRRFLRGLFDAVERRERAPGHVIAAFDSRGAHASSGPRRSGGGRRRPPRTMAELRRSNNRVSPCQGYGGVIFATPDRFSIFRGRFCNSAAGARRHGFARAS